MKYKVNISPEAIKDINGIYEYISQVLCEENTAIRVIYGSRDLEEQF